MARTRDQIEQAARDEGVCPEGWQYPTGWHAEGRVCGRELKTEDQKAAGMCGIHLGAKRRRDKANTERREAEERDAQARAESEETAARFRKAFALEYPVKLERRVGTYHLVLHPADARRMVSQLNLLASGIKAVSAQMRGEG